MKQTRGVTPLAKQELQFRFHDPNPTAATAALLLDLLVQANQPRLEELLRQAADAPPWESGSGHIAENAGFSLTLG